MGNIFISYSHIDAKYSHKLARALIKEGFDVWIDDRIDYGETWPDEIQKHLDASEAFIVVMTPRSYHSFWVQNELSRATREGKAIFPLLLEGESWLTVDAIQYVDVRDGNLPPEKFYDHIRQKITASSTSQPDKLPNKPKINYAKLKKPGIAIGLFVISILMIGFVYSILHNKTLRFDKLPPSIWFPTSDQISEGFSEKYSDPQDVTDVSINSDPSILDWGFVSSYQQEYIPPYLVDCESTNVSGVYIQIFFYKSSSGARKHIDDYRNETKIKQWFVNNLKGIGDDGYILNYQKSTLGCSTNYYSVTFRRFNGIGRVLVWANTGLMPYSELGIVAKNVAQVTDENFIAQIK